MMLKWCNAGYGGVEGECRSTNDDTNWRGN
jgi:hypothetical protein